MATLLETLRERARRNPYSKFFAAVHEHGGWWLGYCRDGSIWSTANDGATIPPTQARPARFSGRTIRRA